MLLPAGCYVFLKTLLLLLYGAASLPDFLLAYKAFIYLVLLAFFVGKSLFDGRRLAGLDPLALGGHRPRGGRRSPAAMPCLPSRGSSRGAPREAGGWCGDRSH